jgi:hypothetical protein
MRSKCDIRVDLGKEVRPGIFEYRVAAYPEISGSSRQPLLDACRQIKRMGGPLAHRVGLFREGRTTCDLSCSVEIGAGLTVSEDPTGICFRKWTPKHA